MNELAAFVALGFRHIVDVEALDHILFLLALAAIYRVRDWRDAVWVVSAFTVGHSVTLALAVTGALTVSAGLVEFLIPLTIVATCIENLIVRKRRTRWGGGYRPVLAAVFGLVHGAGFASYLRSLFVDRIAVPLFGFNLGIELGQLVVLTLAAVALAALDRLLALPAQRAGTASVLLLRVITVSAAVALIAARWAVERRPF